MDVDTSRWHWKEGDEEVPIVLPRNYLNLYNFGFASSQGLPALSESLVSMVKIRFILRGSTGRKDLTGRVVAFSKKLNTILVPQAFMDEMNTTLSPERKPEPSRLIVTVSNPADERIAEYLSNHSYETEADDAEAARTAHLLRIIISIVLVVGLIISALAVLCPPAQHLPAAAEEHGEDRHPVAHRLLPTGSGTPLSPADHQPQHTGTHPVCHHRITVARILPPSFRTTVSQL